MAVQHASTAPPTLDDSTLDAFRASLRGEVLRPDDAGYGDARRVWNAMVDRRPALIARCAGAADVVAAVHFARERGFVVSVKGGGHSVAGKAVCEDGLMIDLSPMRAIHVDPTLRTARAGGGRHLGRLRPRDPGLRSGDHRRRHPLDRHRRPDPRRRSRLSDAPLRSGL